jgi:hypothetical protein
MTNNNDKYNGVKFSYIFDPNNLNRRVCVARRIVGDTIEFAFSVNNPPEYRIEIDSRGVEQCKYLVKHGDVFNKAKARMIAFGRLNKTPFVCPNLKDSHPVKSIAKFVVENSFTDKGKYVEGVEFDRIVARTLAAELAWFNLEDAFKAEEKQWEATEKAS